MATAVVGGKIVTETSTIEATLILDHGKIVAILSPKDNFQGIYPGITILDVTDRYVVPGGVDGHVHFGGFGELPIADDFYTGSLAALAGGTTTVVDFCQPKLGQSAIECVRSRKADATISIVDYSLHFTFTENYRDELTQLDDVLNEGIVAFKAYTCYPNLSLHPGDFRVIMEHIRGKGVLLVHAEEKSIIDTMKEQLRLEKTDMTYLSLSRPNIAEQIAVETILLLSKETGVHTCIAHSSSKETAHIRARERTRGNENFILETCPQYLQFNSEKLKGKFGALYTINPPLRSQVDADRLMQAVLQEDISILSTDHCPYSIKYKMGYDNENLPCGVDGVQTRMNYLFSEAVNKRGLSMEAFARLTSTNAAKFYGLYPKKGTIAVGSDADLAIIDPNRRWVYTMDAVAGATDYSIFDNFPLTGKCVCTIKNGEVVMNEGDFFVSKGSGRFLPVTYKTEGK